MTNEPAPDLTTEAEGLIEEAKQAASVPEPVRQIVVPTGDRFAVGEQLPWKGVWWQVAGFPVLKNAAGEPAGYGVLLVPRGTTMGGAKRALIARRKKVK